MKPVATLLLIALTAIGTSAAGQSALKDADLKLGDRLIAEHKCNQCHAQKWADDGKAIYRPKGRINTSTALIGMVERCSNELNLGLFPEEINAMAAALNRDHYHFTQ